MNKLKHKIKSALFAVFALLIFISSCAVCWGESDLISESKAFFVNDKANILDKSLKEHIVGINSNFNKTKEKPQVVVATIPSLESTTIEDYAVRLFEKFKIGNEDYDNGVLILLAPNDRKIRIEVGYGLEGAISDSKAGAILDSVSEKLSIDDFNSAIEGIFNNICNEISKEYEYNSSIFDAENSVGIIDYSDENKDGKVILFWIIIQAIIIIDIFFNKGRITLLLLDIMAIFGNSSGKSSGPRYSGGGGRSGGGGSSRSF